MDIPYDDLLALKTAAILIWIGGLLMLERLLPAAPRRGGWRRIVSNAALWLCNTGLSPLLVLPLTVWAASLALIDWRPVWWSGTGGLIADIILLDFLIYWWHRANHEIRFLWRFHEVHHLDQFLDVTSAVRFHFGEVMLSAAIRAVVIVLLGIPIGSVLVFETLVLISAAFHHSNVKLPPRLEAALARIIITPSIHWVHHHAIRRDTDSNYGTIFSFWDPLFRTRSRTMRTADMSIGVEHETDRPIGRLLLRPFRGPAEGTGRRP